MIYPIFCSDRKRTWSQSDFAEFSGADLVIDCLDNSYEAMLGKWFGNCTKLSIGEWQKIAYKASECFALRMLTL